MRPIMDWLRNWRMDRATRKLAKQLKKAGHSRPHLAAFMARREAEKN